ncbi:putative transcriptional regulatory protein [Beauveria bassiana]|nr:putative transcriptional regulatory protein [Beauveria bassiana]
MPPQRLKRASKACDLCHKRKTRCYAKDGAKNACLRCHTLSLACSLEELDSDSSETHFGKRNSSPKYSASKSSTDSRLEQLERTVGALLERLDASSQNQTGPEEQRKSKGIIQPGNEERPVELDPAPVILIRKAATDAGVSPPGQCDLSNNLTDVISAGLITAPAAYSLLELLVYHESFHIVC